MPRLRIRGFTLIELLVVIAIIGLLAVIVLVSLTVAQTRSIDASRRTTLTEMQQALDTYYADNGVYPAANNSYNTGGAGYGYASQCQVGGYVPTANLVTGLVSGGYIPQLPSDNQTVTATSNCCYEYFVSSTKTNYKLSFFKGSSPTGGCALSSAGTNGLADPVRTGAWAVYSAGGANL
jgi:prepilin-type N-terminal cleavage/methylation domain-containing protein